MSLRMAGVAMLAAALAGCGSGAVEFDRAPAGGKVICKGQPVPFVSVFFEPISDGKKANAGKQGIGYADDKGEFVLSTYDTNDGAVIGKHKVKVLPPLGGQHPDFKCDCVLSELVPVEEVEVVGGQDNAFVINLKTASKAEQAAATRNASDFNPELDD